MRQPDAIFEDNLWSWWLLIPALSVVAFIAIWRWRRWHLRSIMVGASVTFAVVIGVLWWLSWNTHNDIVISKLTPLPDGGHIAHNVYLVACQGEIKCEYQIIYIPGHVWGNEELRDEIIIRRTPVVPGVKGYLFHQQEFSVIKSDFLEKKLGFQFCWFSRSPIPGSSTTTGIYSVVLPDWFLLVVFCSWAPLLLWRRWSKRRHRIKNGLCLTCGFDLRAHKVGDKCPECGTPVPARPEAASPPASSAHRPPA